MSQPAAAQSKSNTIMKDVSVKVLSKEKRPERTIFKVIVANENLIHDLYVHDEKLAEMREQEFYLIYQCKWSGVPGTPLNTTEKTKILKGKPFAFNVNTETEFFAPPAKTVEEALVLPEKSRTSVRGILQSSSGVLTTVNSTRRVLYMTPLEANYPVLDVKLWGEKAQLDLPANNTPILITNLEIRSFQSKKQGNSTALTTIQAIEQEIKLIKGVVEAISEEDLLIYVDGVMLKATGEIITKLANFATTETNIVAKAKGTTIIEIMDIKTKANENKKPKKQ